MNRRVVVREPNAEPYTGVVVNYDDGPFVLVVRSEKDGREREVSGMYVFAAEKPHPVP